MSSRLLYNDFPVNHTILEHPAFKELSTPAKWLYIVLCKLSNRYANDEGKFFRTLDDLHKDTGMSRPTLTKAIKQLKSINAISTYAQQIRTQGNTIKKPATGFIILRRTD